MADIDIEGVGTVRAVAVHLDFSRASRRMAQVNELIAGIPGEARPLVVMGDFNCSWDSPGGELRHLAERLQLHTWDPEDTTPTFPRTGTRIDYILVSRDLAFVDYRVIAMPASDHSAVVASLRRAD